MLTHFSMLGQIWQNVVDFFEGIVAFIPQVIYFLYTCCASLIDFLQYVVRKLVGLDVYYVDGVAKEGDIISEFFSGVLGLNGTKAQYSAMSTVFWSMVVFGIILLVLSTIIAIIKAHYNYDAKKSDPINILFSSVKTFFLMAIIPLTCVFGVAISNVLLRTLDNITSSASSVQIEDTFKNSSANYTLIFEKGQTVSGVETYASYDFFGARSFTNSSTFSGAIFKVAARSANRVRTSAYTPTEESTMGTSREGWTDFGVFTSSSSDEETRREDVADMIDFAFANCLTLNNKNTSAVLLGEAAELSSSFVYFESAVWYLGLINVSCFSKYNVGLVWYYYNLWSFNFFIAFAGIAACTVIFGSIVFGLIARMIRLMALFFVYPPLVGMGPLDNNKAIKEWQKQFLKDVLIGYGAVVGLNLSFLIMDEFAKINFFKYAILNNLMDIVLILVVLSVIKDLIKVLSGFIGGEDAAGSGSDMGKDLKALGSSAGGATLKAASLAMKLGAKATPVGKVLSKISESNSKKRASKANAKKMDVSIDKEKIEKIDQRNAELTGDLEEEKKAGEEETKDFQEILESHASDFASDEAYEDVEQFAGDRSSSKAQEVFYRKAEEYKEESSNIDSDASLTSEEKKQKKSDLSKRLIKEAVEEYKDDNSHAKRAEDIEHEIEVNNEEKAGLEEDIKNIENKKEQKRAKRSKFANALVDLGGASVKAVGSITGVAPVWEDLKSNDSKVPDGLFTLMQTFFQEAYITEETDKVKDYSSKFLTKKQKEDKDKDARKKQQAASKNLEENSAKFKNELIILAQEIARYKNKGGKLP